LSQAADALSLPRLDVQATHAGDSIRLPVPDIALAQDLEARKGLPYQTYIKQLLNDALNHERTGR
jgi:predicted DNA binding CopG/RHH family protein